MSEKIKLLTGDIFDTDLGLDERVAILKLRILVPKLTKSEAIALAVVLANSHSLSIGRWVGVSALRGFSKDLADALLLIQILSSSNKLKIAIELLVAQTEEEDEIISSEA